MRLNFRADSGLVATLAYLLGIEKTSDAAGVEGMLVRRLATRGAVPEVDLGARTLTLDEQPGTDMDLETYWVVVTHFLGEWPGDAKNAYRAGLNFHDYLTLKRADVGIEIRRESASGT